MSQWTSKKQVAFPFLFPFLWNTVVLATIEYGMEIAELEAEKQQCKDLEKQIQMVITGGIYSEHESILRDAAAEFLVDYPEYR